jgi:hypothetical protein
LARDLNMHRRPLIALVDLFRAAEIEIVDRPAALNSSNRRSSSGVQSLYLFPGIPLVPSGGPFAGGIRGRPGAYVVLN